MGSGAMTAETRASVLLELAKQVVAARRLGETAESLARRPLLLHRHVLRTAIDWKKIARALSEDRSRIYHWYRETHSRSILNVKMTGEDRRAIKAMIIAGVRDRSILGPDFYRRVHERFGAKYPRQELRMTYNNALRTQDVRAALEEHGVVLPRRTYGPRAAKQEEGASPVAASPPPPCVLGCAAPPLVPPVGGPVFVAPGAVSALLPPHAPGCLVLALPPGVVPGPGVLPLQTGQGLLGSPVAFACVPCFPPAGYGGVPGCADASPSKG
ncbi:hypothetical protein GL50803_0061066 [Giardia duodenalis]|uniref:Uncharacterized protein n=1 Tax=Giardia intestinalis (strain ATCC 50803 / WB clone C6) TaxID=184922 RepID=A0A644F2K0_GIAIC|nr:hypothetical protein GL50803_0061066 [Giardia intestinalis]KAE8302799.1 hypothetical protein GL50803_0061066 [Giardia intestinalis]